MKRNLKLAILAFTLVFGVEACSVATASDNKFPGEGTGKSGDWTIATTADQTALTIAQRTTGTVHLKTVRSGGYTGVLQYSVNPTGTITTTVANVATTGVTTDADLLITAPASYPPG